MGEVSGSAAAEERDPNGDKGTSSSAIVVRQDLAELSCSLEYDNDDMRGEEPGAAASKETAEGNSSDRNKKTKLKNKKRRGPTNEEAGGTEHRTQDDGDSKPPKKKRRGATVAGRGKQDAGSDARDGGRSATP